MFRLIALLCLLPVTLAAQQAADAIQPEAAGGGAFAGADKEIMAAFAARDAGEPVRAGKWMVAAANPHAVKAGADVLRAGGTAADAMVAVQATLGLVEPQSSGLGGGAFLVWYDAALGNVTTLDGRETAPLAATPRLFQDAEGQPVRFFDAVVGGLSVGAPGTPALMQEAHKRWGRTDWAGLFDHAAGLARDGFAVSPRLAALVARDAERLSVHPETARYFLPGGAPLAEGAILTNPEYARTLADMAAGGADVLYAGARAEAIVAAVQGAAKPGLLSATDLAIYSVRERAPVCVTFRAHDVCGMGPPSSGALTVGQILGMLNTLPIGAPDDPASWVRLGEASRLAFADRGRYMADSDFVPVPVAGLVDPDYLASRAAQIDGQTALEGVEAGTPEWDHSGIPGDGDSLERPSTSHISIVDSYGNALSMTTTIENAFGSRVMANGYLLNNELTDFSFRSQRDGRPVANRVEPGKRPRSSMAPTIVLKDGAPVLVIGSPGGSRIIGYVAQAIVAHLDWGMNVQQAVATGHGVNRFGRYDLEEGTAVADLAPALEAAGYEVALRGLNSGLHAIAITPEGLEGGADPRREGIALGE